MPLLHAASSALRLLIGVGDVYLGNRNINSEMVRDSWAWCYRHYAPIAVY
jgi:hypothetical protein